MSLCSGCNQEKNIVFWIAPDGMDLLRYCRECRSPTSGLPDVYWDGKPEENLANDPTTGQPRVFFSKRAKAEYLKARGLMEAGDRVHGAPVQIHKNQERKVDSRHEVQMALKKVKEMGSFNRRQEFLRIQKEAQYAKRQR